MPKNFNTNTSLLSHYFKPYIKQVFQWLFLVCLIAGIQVVRPFILKYIIDYCIPNKDMSSLISYSVFFLLLLGISVWIRYEQVLHISRIGIEAVNKMRGDLFEHLLLQDYRYFSKTRSGEILARVESDTELIRQSFCGRATMLLVQVLIVTGILISIWFQIPDLFNYFFGGTAIIVLLMTVFAKIVRKLFAKAREAYKTLSGFLEEYLQGMEVIRSFGINEKACDSLEVINNRKLKADIKASLIHYGSTSLNMFITNSLIIIGLIYMGTEKIKQGNMTIGDLIVAIEYSRLLFEPLHHLSEEFGFMQNTVVAITRVRNMFAEKTEIETQIADDLIHPEFLSNIEFRNVWFAYEEENWVLKDFSLKIEKGEKIAVVGPSGAGKSTIIKLLYRFYDPQKGDIFLDGVNIRELPPRNLRKIFSLVLQENYFFEGTIHENIVMNQESKDETPTRNALEKLGVTSIFEKFEEGIHTTLAQGAKNLSTGEKQLMAFSRALVHGGGILVLDEATAFVDSHTERKIQNALDALMESFTFIAIAHRLSTILHSNQILVMKDGFLVEQGTHTELLSQKGLYEKMYRLQEL